MSKKIEFGDFQTPIGLAKRCVKLISTLYKPDFILEPTCGEGYFLEAAFEEWGPKKEYQGYEINGDHIKTFRSRRTDLIKKINVNHSDFFKLDLTNLLSKHDRPAVIGNPPWVTNSQLGTLSSNNLPEKSNLKGLGGFDALSGKSNFDISEWIILKLTELLSDKSGFLAMLCKTSVARKVFINNYKAGHYSANYKIFKIDSKAEFGVSVDACLFICDYSRKGAASICEIYEELNLDSPSRKVGIVGSTIISDLDLNNITSRLVSGTSSKIWRSGIKHDASKVMELTLKNGALYNGYGDIVNIENEFIFPLLKSSDIANNRLISRKFVIVPQKKVGEDTNFLKQEAPLLWAYFSRHTEKLNGRKSSIYKKQPKFSIFGIGDYSFKPYKIAISGLYKKINFTLLRPQNGKPCMVDDTCYLIGFDTFEEAVEVHAVLQSKLVTDYLSSLIFWDSKRPINAELLKSIDISKASQNHIDFEEKSFQDLSM